MSFLLIKHPKNQQQLLNKEDNIVLYKKLHQHDRKTQQTINEDKKLKQPQIIYSDKTSVKKCTVMLIQSKIERKHLQITNMQNNQIPKETQKVFYLKNKQKNGQVNVSFQQVNKLNTSNLQNLATNILQDEVFKLSQADFNHQKQIGNCTSSNPQIEQKDELCNEKCNPPLLKTSLIKSEKKILDDYELILNCQKAQLRKTEEDSEKQGKPEFKETSSKELIKRVLRNCISEFQITQTGQSKKQKLNIEKEIQERVSLFLTDDSLKKTYYSRPWEEKQNLRHWGQRKLLLIEIYFLINWGHLSKTVIYVGAAPGQHITMLSILFKNHNFILYDPNDFQIQKRSNISIIQKYFDEMDATSLKQIYQGNYLFISDIRTANYKDMSSIENERQILKDNQYQMRWVQMMKPKKSMLKFRCTYPTEIQEPTEFFKGQILIQPWAPQSSTETRLIPDDCLEKRLYDNRIYEEQLFFHNDETRKYFHLELDSQVEGMDGGWDSCAEWFILSNYIQKFRQSGNLKKDVEKLSLEITASIQSEFSTRLLSDKKKKNI